MLYGFLLTLFIIVSLLLVLIIMIQQSKGSMGIGSFGGGAQMLFGGSGGQDIFQKITWTLGFLFMIGSFVLTLMRAKESHTSKYLTPTESAITQPLIKKAETQPRPAAPAAQEPQPSELEGISDELLEK